MSENKQTLTVKSKPKIINLKKKLAQQNLKCENLIRT